MSLTATNGPDVPTEVRNRHLTRRTRRMTARVAELTARWRKTAARAERLRREIDRGVAEIADLVLERRRERVGATGTREEGSSR